MNIIRRLLFKCATNPYELSLFDWQQSLFWAFLGIASVGSCISSSNKRIQTEYKRLELQQQRNELLKQFLRAQEQVAEQQKQLQTAESVLVDSSNGKLRWAELQQRLLSVIGS